MVDIARGSSLDATWQNRLEAAGSEGEVLSIAREFVSSLPASLITALPPDLGVGEFKHAADISAYAFSLALYRLRSDAYNAGDELAGISHFFVNAANRLAQLSPRPPAADR